MKLGLLTAAFPGKSLSEVAEWANSQNGFQMLELACWAFRQSHTTLRRGHHARCSRI